MKRTIPILVAALLTTTLGIAHAEKQADSKPAKAKVALEGYCPVAYVEMGKGGTTYLFSNADAKKMFDADAEGVIAKSDAAWVDLSK